MLAGMHSTSSQRYASGTVWNWPRRCSYWHPCSSWWMLSSLLMKYSSNITCKACAKRFSLIVVTIKFSFPDYWRCQQAWCQLGKLGRKLVDCVLQIMSAVSVSVDRHCEELSRILADFYQRHWGRRVQKLMQFEATSAFGIENWGSFGNSCDELMFVGGRLLLDVCCTYTNSLSVTILHVNLITCLSTLPPGVYQLPVNPSSRCLSLACQPFLQVFITCLSTLPPGDCLSVACWPFVLCLQLFQSGTFSDKWLRFLQAKCRSWYPVDSVKALKWTQSRDPGQCKRLTGLVVCWYTAVTWWWRQFKAMTRASVNHALVTFNKITIYLYCIYRKPCLKEFHPGRISRVPCTKVLSQSTSGFGFFTPFDRSRRARQACDISFSNFATQEKL